MEAAIACNLTKGDGISKAVRSACRYVDAGIRTSVNLGKGSGPINHFHSLQTLPFAPYAHRFVSITMQMLTFYSGSFVHYVLERDDVVQAWQDFTHHDFVRQMGDGTLPIDKYKYYMIQDYLYLVRMSPTFHT